MRVFAGPNGSGKSTIKDELRPDWIGAYLNADDMERALREGLGIPLPNLGLAVQGDGFLAALRSELATSTLLSRHGLAEVAGVLTLDSQDHLQVPASAVNAYVAAVLAAALRRRLVDQGTSFTFETVMSSDDKIELMRDARARGYRVYLYFVATEDPAINIERVRLRVSQGGHDVPEDKVRERYVRSIGLLDAACRASDRAYVFDNSGEAHRLIAELEDSGQQLRLHADRLPAWLERSSLWDAFRPDRPDPPAPSAGAR